MFIVIEIDSDWTVGIDWSTHSKGLRLGFIAIHFVSIKFRDFIIQLNKHKEEWINKEV